MRLKIATWNVNSIRLRENQVCRVMKDYGPDLICLQELKSTTDEIPSESFKRLGYVYQVFRGQKSYNGVGIFSRVPIIENSYVNYCLNEDARHIVALLENGIRIENFYVPAGGDLPDKEKNKKFAHKIDFLEEMRKNFERNPPKRTVLVGDLNIAPLEDDVWSHKQLLNVVSHTPEEVELLDSVRESGDFVDVIRRDIPHDKLYSWWSYRSPNWMLSDRGRRLDHIWITNDLLSKHNSSFILKETRSWERPSDHVPVFTEISFE